MGHPFKLLVSPLPLSPRLWLSLAEAYAEKLHLDMRQKFWGYAKDENLDAIDLHKALPAFLLS